jgi:hypothetical protein
MLAAMNTPDQWQSASTVGNGDDHQLIVESQPSAVDQQSQPLTVESCQQLPGDWLIVAPNVNPRVVQEAPQPVHQADNFSFQRQLAGNVRQMDTSCQEQTCHQPSQVAQPSNSLLRQPLAQLGQQGIIKSEVVLHLDSFCCGLGTNNYTGVADNLQMLLTFKVIGG